MSDGQFLGLIATIAIWSIALIFRVSAAERDVMAELKRLRELVGESE